MFTWIYSATDVYLRIITLIIFLGGNKPIFTHKTNPMVRYLDELIVFMALILRVHFTKYFFGKGYILKRVL